MVTYRQTKVFTRYIFTLLSGDNFTVGSPRNTKLIKLIPMVEHITGEKVTKVTGE